MEDSHEKRGWLQGAKTWAKKKLAVINESSETLKAIRRYTKGGSEAQDVEEEKEKSVASSSHSAMHTSHSPGPWDSPSRGWEGEVEQQGQHVQDEEASSASDMKSNTGVPSAAASDQHHSRGKGQAKASPAPGHYSKVLNSKSPDSKLGKVRLVQDIPAHNGVIWCAALSRDNSMLATGGQDGVLRVWRIIPMSETEAEASTTQAAAPTQSTLPLAPGAPPARRLGHSRRTTSSFSNLDSLWGGGPIPPPEPVIDSNPHRVFEGHVEDILDISWSRGNMILSASVDKMVKLWHVNEATCLRTFRLDLVTH